MSMNEEEQKHCDMGLHKDYRPAVKRYGHIPEDQDGMFGVHVSGFTVDVTERYLRETFEEMGKVYVCKVIAVKKPIRVDGGLSYIAFIKFKSEGEAYRAMEKFDGHKVQNCTLSVRPAFVSRKYFPEKGPRFSEDSRRSTSPYIKEGKQKKIQKQNRDFSGQSTSSRHSPSSSNPMTRQQCQENGSSCSLDSTDLDVKDVNDERQDRNPRETYTSVQSPAPDTVTGIVTDYRLREGILDRKHVANFNSALGKELPESVADGEGKSQEEKKSRHIPSDLCSETPQESSGILTCHKNNGLPHKVPVPTRDVHDMQHKTGPHRTSPTKQKITQPNMTPPGMTSLQLSHSNLNDQLRSQDQLPMHSNNSFIHNQTPCAHSRNDVSPSGSWAQDAVTPLGSALSHLGMPGATSLIPHPSKDVIMWSVQEVADYVGSSECSSHADFFLEQDIDGQALMLLERDTLLYFMKVGPALKLLQVIDRLKKSRTSSKNYERRI